MAIAKVKTSYKDAALAIIAENAKAQGLIRRINFNRDLAAKLTENGKADMAARVTERADKLRIELLAVIESIGLDPETV